MYSRDHPSILDAPSGASSLLLSRRRPLGTSRRGRPVPQDPFPPCSSAAGLLSGSAFKRAPVFFHSAVPQSRFPRVVGTTARHRQSSMARAQVRLFPFRSSLLHLLRAGTNAQFLGHGGRWIPSSGRVFLSDNRTLVGAGSCGEGARVVAVVRRHSLGTSFFVPRAVAANILQHSCFPAGSIPAGGLLAGAAIFSACGGWCEHT